jgi:hypothetical protein
MSGRYERNPGRIVDLTPGSSRDLLDLRWKDEIARVICVTLIGPPASGPDGANAAVCVAVVQWGAGEAETEAEIDFGVGGVVFTVPASSIRITADYEATFAGGERAPTVRVGAFASVGSGDRHARLTRTRIAADQIDPGASTAFEVPPFARAIRVLAGDQATRALRLDFFSDSTAPPPAYSVEIPAGSPAPPVDLTPDITSVLLTNTGAAALTTGARAVFELGI